MRPDLGDALFSGGLLLLAAGLWLIHPSAALIAGGLALLAFWLVKEL
jgi:hypothetical protein